MTYDRIKVGTYHIMKLRCLQESKKPRNCLNLQIRLMLASLLRFAAYEHSSHLPFIKTFIILIDAIFITPTIYDTYKI